MFGSDPLTAYCPDGSRGGEAYDSKHWVNITIHLFCSSSYKGKFLIISCDRNYKLKNIFAFCRNIMSNKVFYQHPNLMRALGMHETVMEVMVNVLGGGDSKVYFLFHSTTL